MAELAVPLDDASKGVISAQLFRTTLGNYPTGVVIVSANHPRHGPVGLAIGSFSSVSLDPPLVGFLPDKASTSWPKIEATGRFCVNVLAADQLGTCRAFASQGGDKYVSTSWRPASTGSPILDDVLAWIDCDIESVEEAGDHWFVLGRVRELAVARDDIGPLLFFRGAYGVFDVLATAVP